MSNFSFSYSIFYPFGKLSTIFIKFKLLSANSFNLEGSKIYHGRGLETIHSVNQFRYFVLEQNFYVTFQLFTIKLWRNQIKSICRGQAKFFCSNYLYLEYGRKHFAKRKKYCCTLFAKDPSVWISWLRINPLPYNFAFWRTKDIQLWKTLWEKEKLLITINFSFLTMFSTLYGTYLLF